MGFPKVYDLEILLKIIFVRIPQFLHQAIDKVFRRNPWSFATVMIFTKKLHMNGNPINVLPFYKQQTQVYFKQVT